MTTAAVSSRSRRALRFLALGVLSLLGIEIGFRGLDAAFPFPHERLERSPARVVTSADGEPLRLFLAPDGSARWPVPHDAVSPKLVRSLRESEDRFLGWHPGVNPLAVARAALANLRAGRVVSGASTIPMQLARLVEPRARTWRAKAIEAFRAHQLVRAYSSEELLAAYLGLAPFGGNLEGVGAGAWFWFGKSPAELSLGEAAYLTALPRAPVAYDARRHPDAARRARDRVLDQLTARGVFDAAGVARAKRQSLPERWQPTPFTAPHFARWAAGQSASRAVATTLDADLQRQVEGLVTDGVRALRKSGIGNAAVVVLDNQTRSVRAMVGSADFFDTERPGQVNGALARRSPGSTLKPWVYAQAFAQGLAVPDTITLDIPVDYAGYLPENYDGSYRGRMTLREALAESRNVPAVTTLAELGVAPFLALLQRAGFATLDRPAARYGLPLVLGGGEVTLLDLTNAYATLGSQGLHQPVRWQPGPAAKPQRLLPAAAVALVTNVLRDVRRPDFPPAAVALARDVPEVAWKTGTSYGHRDAWAVGYSTRMSVGVWVGNLDGSPRPGISVAEHAAPLLFDVFRAVEPEGARLAKVHPRIVDTEVCSVSHELPGAYCPARIRVPTLPGVSRLARCTHHRRVFVDAESGERLEGACLEQRPHRPEVLTVFPAALRAWWLATGQPSRALPSLHPECREVYVASGPRISSPDAKTPYRQRHDAPAAYSQLRLAADAAPGTETLYWYQDGSLVGIAPPERAVFVPLEPGAHRVVVMDDAGRSHRVEYHVEGRRRSS
ncbi:MAG: penicillin-binding protein 1C [Myxococcota bacterium]